MREGCREYDYVARMGGDEFVLLLPGMTADSVAARIAEFRKSIADAVDLLPEPCSLSMRAGASFFPTDSTEAEELLSSADLRMYKAKRRQTPELKALELPVDDANVLPLTYQ